MAENKTRAVDTDESPKPESKIDSIIRRFESGDTEVQYENIQSAQELHTDAMDGDSRLAAYGVSGLPVPQCSVEERLRPLNPFYIEKTVKKKRFIPDISNTSTGSYESAETVILKEEIAERKAKADGKKAQKAAEKFSVSASPQVPTKVRRSTSQMPVSYNGFIATNLINHKNYHAVSFLM